MLEEKLTWEIGEPAAAYPLPARFFYDPGVFAQERDAIFYKAWHQAAHENELAGAGAYVVLDIFDQSVILIRGEDGEVRAFHNVCQHRGNRLINQRRGKAASLLRCGYHSWCYSHDGALRRAPRSEKLEHFDASEFGLKKVRLERFAGFYFVNL